MKLFLHDLTVNHFFKSIAASIRSADSWAKAVLEPSMREPVLINCCQYEIGRELGQGGFGTVYEGTRVRDGLKPGYPEPIPREVYLQMLACKGEYAPAIVQFLDWQDRLDHYVMVLERPSPCEDLSAFMIRNGGRLSEKTAQAIMWQATEAAEICCMRGVFHRDIKLDNFLINPCTLDVKLIDFGCGDLLKTSAYTEYMGTRLYTCPEFIKMGKYHGKPATVYSLGVLLFALVCGKFPDRHDRHQINKKIWHEDGFSEECCDLIQACMQKNPEKRIQLEEILNHK
ncbi:putative serine/threonine-protein kinase pim-1-like, partial [Triplophysa rosa]